MFTIHRPWQIAIAATLLGVTAVGPAQATGQQSAKTQPSSNLDSSSYAPPAGIAVAAGWRTSLVVAEDGLAYGAGWNDEGQLTGTTYKKRTLTFLTGLPAGVKAMDVAAGSLHSLVIADDGVVYGTGYNSTGEITGFGNKATLTPLTGLPAGVKATDIAAGHQYSLVVADDGMVYGTGWNRRGQLTGNDHRKRTLTPLTGLPTGVKATDIAAGSQHSLVVADDGLIYGTGYNSSGQLTGTGNKRNLTPLTGMPAGVKATAAAAASFHSLVVADDGLVYGTGRNFDGQLTGEDDRATLTPLTGLPAGVRAAAAATGSRHSLVMGDNGVAYGTGWNHYGQLTGTGRKRVLSPLTGLPAGVRATDVAAGDEHSLVVADDGLVYGTGRNGYGQLTGTRLRRTLTLMTWGIANTVRPRITGTPQLGSLLTARHGQWWPVPASYTYRWYRDGTAMKGARAQTHEVTRRDIGTQLRVRVTAKNPGYLPASLYTKRTMLITRR